MKKVSRLLLFLLIAVGSILQPIQAMAAGNPVTATIPVKVEGPEGTITVSNYPEVEDPYRNDGPLPTTPSKKFSGEETFDIVFTEVGNYVYKIEQSPQGRQGHDTFDDTFYKYFITVTYDADGNLTYAAEAMTNGRESEKPDEICFVNESDKTWTVKYLDGDHGKSSNPSESGKYTGEHPKGGNVVTPDKGYEFTGTYTYVIVDDDGNVLEEGSTDDPTSVVITGHVIFTPYYREKTYWVRYEDGDHGTSDKKGNEEGKHYGDKHKGGNTVTPNPGYRFTGVYQYVIYKDDGTEERGTTTDPTSILVTGNIVFTPLYEPIPPTPTNPPTPSKPSTPGRPAIPFTGDNTNLMLYGGLLLVALAVMVGVLKVNKSYK